MGLLREVGKFFGFGGRGGGDSSGAHAALAAAQQQLRQAQAEMAESNKRCKDAQDAVEQLRGQAENLTRQVEESAERQQALEREGRLMGAALEESKREAARFAAESKKQIDDLAAQTRAAEQRAAQLQEKADELSRIEAERRAEEERRRLRYEAEQKRLRDFGMDNIRDINIAVCGISGTGKSTMINCICGRRHDHPDAGKTQAGAECTDVTTKYTMPDVEHLKLWDHPGGNTGRHPAETYFRDQCLDLFDLIVVVWYERWPELNTYIVKKALEANRPIVLVYSKVDVDIFSAKKENRNLDEAQFVTTLRDNSQRAVLADLVKSGIDAAEAAKLPMYMVDSFSFLYDGLVDAEFDGEKVVEAIVKASATRNPLCSDPNSLWNDFKAAYSQRHGNTTV